MTRGPGIPPPRTPRRAVLVAALGALSAFGPLSMDFYLPGMPELAAELGAHDVLAQATMAACMVGLAVGQLVVGPWSDRAGRRLPLLAGVALFTLSSVACAFAPTIEVLLAIRFVQGLAGAAGLVVARAIVRDLYSGAAAARAFSHLMLVIGLAPILAPLAGGALLTWLDWRGLFLALGGVGAALFVVTALVVPDTLRDEHRAGSGAREVLGRFALLARHRRFVWYALAMGANAGILFSYVSMSSLIYQGQFGLDAQAFALVFALNAVGMIVASQANGLLVTRVDPRRLLFGSLTVALVGGVLVAATGVFALPLVAVAVSVAIATGSHGFSMPNINALGLQPFAKGAGSASAVLGAMQFLVGGIVPPLVSGGGVSVALMGTTMVVCAVAALGCVALAGLPGAAPPQTPGTPG